LKERRFGRHGQSRGTSILGYGRCRVPAVSELVRQIAAFTFAKQACHIGLRPESGTLQRVENGGTSGHQASGFRTIPRAGLKSANTLATCLPSREGKGRSHSFKRHKKLHLHRGGPTGTSPMMGKCTLLTAVFLKKTNIVGKRGNLEFRLAKKKEKKYRAFRNFMMIFSDRAVKPLPASWVSPTHFARKNYVSAANHQERNDARVFKISVRSAML